MAPRVIVAHPGQQHSFRTAVALRRHGMLASYVTTVYSKRRSLLMGFLRLILPGDNARRAEARRCRDLPDSEVVQFCQLLGLVELLVLRLNRGGRLYVLWNRATSSLFGRRVARFAIRQGVDAVVMYDSNALSGFKLLKRSSPGIVRILDSSTASRAYMKELFTERADQPMFAALKRESVFFWSERQLRRFEREFDLADLILVPSRFVRDSMIATGVDPKKIQRVPYGVNLVARGHRATLSPDSPVRFLFVGQCTARKGVNYLLEAFRGMAGTGAELLLVGGPSPSLDVEGAVRGMEGVHLVGHVPHEDVAGVLAECDVFVFPSLAEGMSLAGLEAMGFGLPIICTENSGVSDLVVEGESGFVVPVCDSAALRAKMQWFVDHRDSIRAMGEAARATAVANSWDVYGERLALTITEKLTERRSHGSGSGGLR